MSWLTSGCTVDPTSPAPKPSLMCPTYAEPSAEAPLITINGACRDRQAYHQQHEKDHSTGPYLFLRHTTAIRGNSDKTSNLLSLPHIRYNPAITGITDRGSKHRSGTRKRTRNAFSGSSVPLSYQSSAFFRSSTSTQPIS